MRAMFLLMAFFPLMVNSAQPDLALYNATRRGAVANVRLHVVDLDGNPVSQARLWGGMQTGEGMNDFTPIDGLTDTNGDFVVSGKCTRKLRCGIDKEGYYQTEFSLSFPVEGANPPVVDGNWQPFGKTCVVVLKTIKNPGKCCVFPISLRNCRIPEFGKWLGFDFEYCKWTPPYGDGQHADVLLKFSSAKNGLHNYRYVMDVSFTNNPSAGAYQLKKDESSDLSTVYDADTNAVYQTMFSFMSEQIPNNPRHWEFLDSESYLVFRTRTRIDEHGNLLGAHYGKILGRWLSGSEFMILSDGCFNPRENDVNIEDGNSLRDILKNMKKRR